MFHSIPYQVQSASNSAKFTLQRLGGMSIPYFEDDETTFEQLQARIDTTIKFLEGADPKCMDGVEDKEVMMETRGPKFKFETGQRYVSEYQMPKFYFHIVTTYCILRQRGVPIDMVDYLKDVLVMVE